MRPYTILYVRKSSEEDDRQTLSLDAQEKECRAYADRHGLTLHAVIREAHSARKPGRPRFGQMLSQVQAAQAQGRPVTILCHKPDRLLRNLADWAKINDLTEAGLECLFVTGSYENNAQGKMAFGINIVFAKYYVDNLSEEVKKGQREKIARGEWPCWAPMGYRNVDRQVELDPETAPLVRRAFEYYASGEYSLRTLGERLYAEGLRGRLHDKKLAKAVLRDRILTNPFYCGLLRYRGELYPGNHEPLVSRALFEQVQAMLTGKGRPRRIRHSFRFGGLLQCGHCGGAIVGDIKKGCYIYYRCSHQRGPCPEGYVRQEALAAALIERVRDQLSLPSGAIRAIRMAAEDCVREGEQAGPEQRRGQWERRLEELERRLGVLVDLRLAGHLSEEEYLAKRQELLTAQAEARQQLSGFELPRINPREQIAWFIDACNALGMILAEGEDAEVRELLRIVGSNYRLQGKTVTFDAQKPFDWVETARHRSHWSARQFDVRNLAETVAAFRQTWPAAGATASTGCQSLAVFQRGPASASC